MNKRLLLVASIALLAAGCGKSAPAAQPATVSGTNQPVQQANSQTNLKALMASGSPQKCTVSYSTDNNQTQGTIYIDSGKMRADFTAQIQGSTKVSHMINDGTYVYTWLDGMATGFKMQPQMNMAPTSTPQSGMHNPNGSQRGIDPNANYQYNCSVWTADSSEFVPPTSVTFSDMQPFQGQMHGQAPGSMGSTGGNSQACAACDSAGANKAECLTALGCK
jgi:hypothetical protein